MAERGIVAAEGTTLGYHFQTRVTDGEIEVAEKPQPLTSSAADEETFGHIAQEQFGK